MKPRDLKGRFIKTTPKAVANLFGGNSTPPPSNLEDRLSGEIKGKSREAENQPGSLDRSLEET